MATAGAAAKACDGCDLCCTLLAITDLDKGRGVACRHAVPGQGCGVYGSHPEQCRGFRCGWLDSDLDARWKPDACHFIVRAESNGQRLAIDVDPAHPDAWRRAPFYEQIKRWSQAAWGNTGHVMVFVGMQATAIFPEEDLVLGAFGPEDSLSAGYWVTPDSVQPAARIVSPGGEVREVRGQARARGPAVRPGAPRPAA